MINKIIEGLYNFLFTIVGAFTQPISDAINTNFPDLSTAISSVNSFFNSLSSIIAWCVNLVPKPLTISMLTGFMLCIALTYPTMFIIEYLGKTLDVLKRLWPLGGK